MILFILYAAGEGNFFSPLFLDINDPLLHWAGKYICTLNKHDDDNNFDSCITLFCLFI